jgi:hypothetical protein
MVGRFLYGIDEWLVSLVFFKERPPGSRFSFLFLAGRPF